MEETPAVIAPVKYITKPREVWQEIRALSEDGMSDAELSARFGVTQEAIRKKRSIHNWFSGRRAAEKIESQNVTISKIREEAYRQNATSLQQLTLAKVLKRLSGIDLAKLPIDDMASFEKLYNVGHKAANLDKPLVQFNQVFAEDMFQNMKSV